MSPSEIDQHLYQGDDLFMAGKFLEAAQKYTEVLALYRQNQDSLGEADTLLRLGSLYQRWGEAFHQKAVEIYRFLPPAETPKPETDSGKENPTEEEPRKRFPWKVEWIIKSVGSEPILPDPPKTRPVA